MSVARPCWQAFWRGEALDCPLILATVRRPECTPAWKPYPVDPFAELGPVIDGALAWAEGHDFLGAAFPYFMLEFGPEHFATFLGAEMRYQSGTGWIVPCVEDWRTFDIRLHRESFYWRRTLECIRLMRSACEDKLLINAPVLSAGLDVLAALRGPEALLVDLVECPALVQRALAGVRRVYQEVVSELAEALNWREYGSANWLGMYHPHFINTIQSDISCMLSPAMFREFEVPNLVHQAACYDVVAYHLDGPGAVQHLPDIAAIPGIEIIQYVPVPRETPDAVETVYRTIDALGKGIIRNAAPGEVAALWAASTTKRLILNVLCETRAEAEAVLADYAYDN